MMSNLVTTGEIARTLGIARPRVDYAIEKAGIKERGRAGILRLYSPDQIPVIRAALETVRTRAVESPAKGASPITTTRLCLSEC